MADGMADFEWCVWSSPLVIIVSQSMARWQTLAPSNIISAGMPEFEWCALNGLQYQIGFFFAHIKWMGDCFKAFVFLGSIITSKIHTSVNCVVCLLVQVCEHDYIDGPNLNKTLMTEPNFRILEQKFKLISCDENYTKIQYLSHLRPKSYRITSKNSPIWGFPHNRRIYYLNSPFKKLVLILLNF